MRLISILGAIQPGARRAARPVQRPDGSLRSRAGRQRPQDRPHVAKSARARVGRGLKHLRTRVVGCEQDALPAARRVRCWCTGSACMCAATWRAAGPLPYRRAHAGPAIVGQRGWRRRTVQVCRSRRPRAALAQRRAQSLRKIVMLRLQADAEHRAARPLVHVVLGPLHTQRCRTVMSRSTGELMRVQRADACDVQAG